MREMQEMRQMREMRQLNQMREQQMRELQQSVRMRGGMDMDDEMGGGGMMGGNDDLRGMRGGGDRDIDHSMEINMGGMRGSMGADDAAPSLHPHLQQYSAWTEAEM